MDIKKLYGSIVALVTPFDDNGAIDFPAFDGLIEFHLQNGTSSILISGTTGEGPTITEDELKTMLSRARTIAGDEYPLIAGTGTNSTSSTIQRTKIAADCGADFALLVGPYYNKPTQEGFYRHFESISKEVEIPLIVYNVPGRTGSNILPEFLAMYLNSLSGRRQIFGVLANGAIKTLLKKELEKVRIPALSIQLQKQIMDLHKNISEQAKFLDKKIKAQRSIVNGFFNQLERV